MRLNDQVVRTAQLPEGKTDHFLWDEAVPGFALRVRKSAAGVTKQWLITYRDDLGASRRFAIGSGALPAVQARKTAVELHANIQLGKFPHVAREDQRKEAETKRDRDRDTFGAVSAIYLAKRAQVLRPRSFESVERHLKQHWACFHDAPIQGITRRMVSRQLEEIETNRGAYARNHARTSLITFLTWAVKEDYLDANPAAMTNMSEAVGPRQRTLQDEELAAIWAGCLDDEFGAIVKLLILTGARRTEVGGMRWDELDLDGGLWTMQGARTKNGNPHVVPLVPEAVAILRSIERREGNALLFGGTSYGFSDWDPSKKRLHERIGFGGLDWRLHDFRRTMKTIMSDKLDVPLEHSEALLNHVKRGMEKVYNTAKYIPQKRRALELWADYLRPIIGGGDRKIVQLATFASR
jgi:integrase